MDIPKIQIKITVEKIHSYLQKYSLVILSVLLITLFFLNGLVYYHYVYMVTKIRPQPNLREVVIDQETIDKVLENIEEREGNLLRVLANPYNNPFN